MRGTLVAVLFSFVQLGIIPAYAGNTVRGSAVMMVGRDHPRVCGEHRNGRHHRHVHRGSSPRMRGTRLKGSYHMPTFGIIPAYAGNTCPKLAASMLHRDHPRVCGEHTASTQVLRRSLGSSPRMRGTLLRVRAERQSTGIIPAYAGNTRISQLQGMTTRDHPRVCGEHLTENEAHREGEGSSPRMRGTLAVVFNYDGYMGIIPAYAGNTHTQVGTIRHTRDHPRVCGEHRPWQINHKQPPGSSPRMRGTRAYGSSAHVS